MPGKQVEVSETIQQLFGWQDAEVAERTNEALIMDLLRRHVISQGKAAELLGISRWELALVMGRYMVSAIDLSADDVRQEAEPLQNV